MKRYIRFSIRLTHFQNHLCEGFGGWKVLPPMAYTDQDSFERFETMAFWVREIIRNQQSLYKLEYNWFTHVGGNHPIKHLAILKQVGPITITLPKPSKPFFLSIFRGKSK